MSLTMEPRSSSSSSAAATPNRSKRKRSVCSAAYEEGKRLKRKLEGEETLLPERPPGQPRVSVLPDHLQQPITLKELTELLHYAALGKKGGIKQPSWCRLHHQKKVCGINVAIVEGLTQSHFYNYYLTMQHLRTNYTTRVTFMPSPENVAMGIFRSEVPKPDCVMDFTEERELQNFVKTHPVVTAFGKQKRGLTAYLLSEQEMRRRHYPVKGNENLEEFVCTDSVDTVTDRSPLFGLDCEMCLTRKGKELVRVSLLASDGTHLMDQLVKPQNQVYNYLTKFSGITASMLAGVTTTLRDVQEQLKKLLPRDAVLVGHSIEYDLTALKLIHPHIIDTSLLYKRECGQKFKLKVLAEVVLKRQIQTEEKMGHNPVEDALAALDLAQYFIRTGPQQVVRLHAEDLWGYRVCQHRDNSKPAPTPDYSFASILQTLGRSGAYLGKRSDVLTDLSSQQWHSSDKELLKSFQSQTKRPFLSVLQFSSFANHLHKHCVDPQQHYLSVCAALQDMCVVFAGPFPPFFQSRNVRRLFRCCGPVKRVKILNGRMLGLQVHARVEFKLLEGATLAVKTLNGLKVQGTPLKVQRPVHESMLEVDETLDALTTERHLYILKLRATKDQHMNIPSEVNGHCQDITTVKSKEFTPPERNCAQLEISDEPSEETLREIFGRFGAVEEVSLLTTKEKQARIKFESSEAKHAALSYSDDLQRKNFLICPSQTPFHLPSWVAVTTETQEDDETPCMCSSSQIFQDEKLTAVLKKLDHKLGKLFRSLAAGTLSVVVLLGQNSATGHHPGLCLMEVKQEC